MASSDPCEDVCFRYFSSTRLATRKILGCLDPSSYLIRILWFLLLIAWGVICLSVQGSSAAEPNFMIRARIGQKLVEGQPLNWSAQMVYLLSRDGQLVTFAPDEASDYEKTAPKFSGYSTAKMRAGLYKEFGGDYEISGTRHYLVVHPKGQKDLWADRFESLYRSFVHYFIVRGFQPQEPKFPLIAIVFRTQGEYQRYAIKEKSYLGANTLGHYSPRTNRIVLYDSTGGRGTSNLETGDWSQNADTIIHEATHQTAFNTGIHTRFSGVPRWLSEGLAMMFEARGVWDSRSYTRESDRINVDRLKEFKPYAAKRRKPGSLKQLIARDQLFRRDSSGAYAESWALSHYLCETRPQKYSEYLARTAARPIFENYTAKQRIEDFETTFGDDWKMFEAQFLRYMGKL